MSQRKSRRRLPLSFPAALHEVRIENRARRVRRGSPHDDGTCLLCGGPATFLGLWFPYRPAETSGKAVLPYATCDSCQELPDVADRVEAALCATYGPADGPQAGPRS